MTPEKIKILQIGDLHLPAVIKERQNIDDKDPSFSRELKGKISGSPTKVVFQKLYHLISAGEFDCALFMGDLTDRGALESYGKAVEYIAHSLQIGGERQNKELQVGFVPGNHDVDRALAALPNLKEKFYPLNSFLSENDLPLLPVDNEVTIELTNNHARAKIVLLNSCWGCGAKEFIPDKFSDVIYDAIHGKMNEEDSEEFTDYYDRQLDTPAFSNETITRVSEARSATADDTVEIYVAHHNLLPQRLPRLAPYTELVNSGAMRSALLEGKKPTVFLHGHIHEDPIEIIERPNGASLVCISAPLIAQGFNEVEINYSETGMPLFCLINEWRFNDAGVLKKNERKVIPILTQGRHGGDPGIRKLLAHILTKGLIYFPDILKHQPEFYEDQSESDVREGLDLLYADRMITIENYNMRPQNWMIRSAI